jgi:hypothetical protein
MGAVMSIGAMLLFMFFGLAQAGIGFIGIEDALGMWWATGAVLLALGFRFSLPLTIGAFFGARDVLGWHWLAALAFALPGLLFMVPALLGGVMSSVKRAAAR